jgi:pimeloyl-ACP methyl ester carboxylesterase
LDALAPDFPGFGASPAPTQVMGAGGYADSVAALLDEFDDPPLIVGHSFGGRVAICLAADRPGRVGPLVLTGVPLVRVKPASRPKLSYRAMQSLNRMGVVSDVRMEELRRRSGSTDYRAATGVMRDILVKVINETYEDRLLQIRSPVRLLWGGEDREVPPTVAQQALEILQEAGVDSELEVLEGVGHHVPIRAPGELRRVIDAMVSV